MFLPGIIFLSFLFFEMMYQYILFQIFDKLSLFLFFADVYAMQERSQNISHLQYENPSHKAIWLKFRPFLTKFLRNLIISICEKVRLQQLRKAKYSILASILHIFNFFLQSLIPTCAIHCVNLMVFLYLALDMEKCFKKCDFLEKFILSFLFEQDLTLGSVIFIWVFGVYVCVCVCVCVLFIYTISISITYNIIK